MTVLVDQTVDPDFSIEETTIRSLYTQLELLQKENFDLKLRLFYLGDSREAQSRETDDSLFDFQNELSLKDGGKLGDSEGFLSLDEPHQNPLSIELHPISLTDHLKEKDEQMEVLKEKLQKQNEDMANLSNTLQRHEDEKSAQEKRERDMIHEQNELKRELEHLKEELEEKEGNVRTLKDQSRESEEELEELRKRVGELEQDLREMKSKEQDHQTALEDEILALKKDLREKKMEQEKLEEQQEETRQVMRQLIAQSEIPRRIRDHIEVRDSLSKPRYPQPRTGVSPPRQNEYDEIAAFFADAEQNPAYLVEDIGQRAPESVKIQKMQRKIETMEKDVERKRRERNEYRQKMETLEFQLLMLTMQTTEWQEPQPLSTVPQNTSLTKRSGMTNRTDI
ncbi:hypothetical protein BLNAU_2828 [Blattamonas nauphoetae]|uniref:Centrosomin N-terminal motif 1 domain-containing protein n=1 Tax=Blattamonas nauphoetae TaxID=2049346 RepID=A0ABQ9YER4_9EUKA|nr:hypothetical protein BLNAU_2828 [Blattamonas nauphoetae]